MYCNHSSLCTCSGEWVEGSHSSSWVKVKEGRILLLTCSSSVSCSTLGLELVVEVEGKQLVEADLLRPVLAAEAGSRCEAEAALLSRPVPVSLILAASACNNQHRVTKPVQLRHTGSRGTFSDFMDISQMFLNVFCVSAYIRFRLRHGL